MITSISSLTHDDIECIDKKKLGILLKMISRTFVEGDIRNDGLNISSLYKNTAFLSTMNSKSFLQNRNQLLLDFITGAINFDYTKQDNSLVLYSLAVVVETVYLLRNMNLILPHCFLANLVQSFISGSKTVSLINGKISPSASYTTYKNWLVEKGSKPLVCPTNQDTITFFDNIGKYIVKSYRVLSEKLPSADIITATLHFTTEGSNLQNDCHLMPGEWRMKTSVENFQSKLNDRINVAKHSFRQFPMVFIERVLQMVAIENCDVEDKISAKQASLRKCVNENCLKSYDSLKRKCDLCGSNVEKGKIVKERLTSDQKLLTRHFDFGVTEKKNKTKISMGEPVIVNPNSYESLKKVLGNLKEQIINGNRKWTFLGCDGPPFCLASRLIENDPEEYAWVSMVSGLGHLHMNQLKAFFKVADKILLEPLGKEVLNFQSPKAYDFFIKAKDTHKSFQTLTILLEGTALEFYSMYLKETEYSGSTNVQSFLAWADNNPNETFHLVFQLIFNFALAIYVMKVGVRCNNCEMIESGRLKFLPLFYGFRHPIYQELEYRELFNRASYPDSVLEFMNDNMAFSSSNLEKNHQGGDFCLETKIKRHKMIAPKGRITNATWRYLSRGLDELEKVYENAAQILKIDDGESYRDIDLYDEIVSWRAVLRSSGMLECREEEGVVKNIYGEIISMELDDLTIKLDNKMKHYWEKAKEGTPLQNIRTAFIPIVADNEEIDSDDDGNGSYEESQ